METELEKQVKISEEERKNCEELEELIYTLDQNRISLETQITEMHNHEENFKNELKQISSVKLFLSFHDLDEEGFG